MAATTKIYRDEMKKEIDAYKLYISIVEFVALYRIYPSEILDRLDELLVNATHNQAEEAAIEQFVAQLKHIRSPR